MTMADTHKGISRRRFLELSAFTGFATLLGPSFLTSAYAAGGHDNVLTAAHWGAFRAKVKDGKFVEAVPFSGDKFPNSLVTSSPEYVYSPSRIKYPMVRKGFLEKGKASDTSERGKGEFVRVSWEKALELVSSELHRVKKEHGVSAIYGGSPGWRNLGKLHNSSAALHKLLNLHGGYTSCVGDYSTGASQIVMGYVMGNMEVYSQQSTWPTVIEHSEQIIIWGSDPLTTLKMGWSVPDHEGQEWIEKLKQSGKKIIVIDPIRNDTSEYLHAEHIAPRPNTDVAMMLGMAYTLIEEDLVDVDFLDEYTVGYDKVSSYITGGSDSVAKTPEWASDICGIPASVIRELARSAAKHRTMLMSGWSMQRADHGEQAHWMLVTLASMLGQIGLPGGGFGLAYHYSGAGSPTADAPGLPGFSAGKTPEGMPPAFPVARITDALLEPGKTIDFNGKKVTYPDIKLIYWAGGNPFHHQQDRNKLIKAWRKPETIIVNEMFWTSTARFADIVLPACTNFEQNDIERGGDYSAKYIMPMKKVIDPLYESKSTYEIFSLLAKQMGYGDAFTEGKGEMDWVASFYDSARKQGKNKKLAMPDFSSFWEKNEELKFEVKKEAQNWVRHAEYREEPYMEPLGTASGKIELFSRDIEKMQYDDCPPHASWIEPAEWLGSEKAKQYPLHLLSPHPKNRLHSQMNNVKSLRKKYTVKDREPVLMSVEDAKARNIKDGDIVRVFNDRGQVLAGAKVSDRIRAGVIRLREGGWYDPLNPGEDDSLCKYGHVNVLTLDKGSSKLAQATVANTALVQIEKFKGKIPAVTVFDSPHR
ncbi:trimethylamine-N-oxide reductase TorA [Halodesulfovibrio marinisediminis]|uniref:trimethylamine-N-oxide reductase n=1 Tax=Halodesulfovibrio marinisediminis DSM 17456 TaxID=1121457 RepID=A0A1N6ECL6_9BACT|nr:trimethylamine-N-oxide reductase TorA [Halodesulfovibrio marinisediminis]SIN80711.1 trimethylamine-N-oxide reductase (cytochrome c) [Halodesulfovibrio marinisediminis DSM 17456]